MIVIMKKLYFILLVLCFTTACNFLEIDTENKIATSEVDYSNTTNMYLPVIGAYTQLRTSGMHWANQMIWAGRDDDMNSGRTDDQGDALLFSYRGGYQCPNSFWAVNNAWVTMYEIIRTCNSAQKALDEYGNNLSKNSESYATYLSYTGEITTIKAWAYYMMATTFGACVLLTDNDQDYYIRYPIIKSSILCVGHRLTIIPSLCAFATMERVVPSVLHPITQMSSRLQVSMVSSVTPLLKIIRSSDSGPFDFISGCAFLR